MTEADTRETGDPGESTTPPVVGWPEGAPPPTDRPMSRADLHIHTLASDGVDGVEAILAAALVARLKVIAITDHERIDAAVVAQRLARERGLPLEVIVGEEISTRNGHLVALFLDRRIKPWGRMRDAVAEVHEQGGLAIVAHPLVPYPLCASEGTIRRLLDEADPARHPDAIEAYNPTTARMRWSARVPAFAFETGLTQVASSDAHLASAVGRAITRFRGDDAGALRRAIVDDATAWEGTAYAWSEQLGMFRQQTAKNARAVRDTIRHRVMRQGDGRDLGYPR
ncbi:MAG: PHP-associated domain-containing protein [Candidatus Limnocylindrales bacterium]